VIILSRAGATRPGRLDGEMRGLDSETSGRVNALAVLQRHCDNDQQDQLCFLGQASGHQTMARLIALRQAPKAVRFICTPSKRRRALDLLANPAVACDPCSGFLDAGEKICRPSLHHFVYRLKYLR
jgi:hypothetical protein